MEDSYDGAKAIRTMTELRKEASPEQCFKCGDTLQWATEGDNGDVILHRAGRIVCCSKQTFPDTGTYYIGMCEECCTHNPSDQ